MGRDVAGTGEPEMPFDSFFYKDSQKILADKMLLGQKDI